MGNYNSTDSHIPATHMHGDSRRMLLLHITPEGRHEYIIGSYFKETRYDGDLGYGHWDYSWDWGHYFQDFAKAVDYWQREVVAEGIGHMEGLRTKQCGFEDYMTQDKWDACCAEGIYMDDGIRAVSMFLEFCETGRVTDDDGNELEG